MRRVGPPDEGAYAILYGLLIVVLIGMTSMVVDLGLLRSDKRDARTAADNAALAGAAVLGNGPYTPQKACAAAWTYAFESLNLAVPATNPCAGLGLLVTSCPSTETTVSQTSGDITVRVTWPVLSTSAAITNPDGLAPNQTRSYDSTFDGSDDCGRLGVQVVHARALGLASALGVSTGVSNAYSLARLTVKPTTGTLLAGLNILDTTACQSLYVSGQGKIIVNRATDGTSSGTIAVESDGSGCPGNNNKFVIDLGSNASAQICVSGPNQVPDALGTCDGQGKIEEHSLDGANGSVAYSGSPGTPLQNLRPQPVSEGGVQGWLPVTSHYGCATLPGCGATPPYIPSLYADDNGTWPPTTVYSGSGTYLGSSYGAFQTLTDGEAMGSGTAVPGGLGTFTCQQSNQASTSFYVPAGNWLVDCKDSNNQPGFQVSQRAIFGGGHLVFRGGIKVNGGSCFSVNTPFASLPATPGSLTCPSTVSTSNEQATTSPSPLQDALVFIRGSQGFVQGSSATTILLPQTMVVQANGGGLSLGAGSGTLLWTAPGAGTVTSGQSALDADCPLDVGTVTTCHDSHFAKTVYWNESALTGSSNALTINGQGGLVIVGTFFAPRSAFVFAGQGSYVATSAQFWVDTLQLSGQGGLGMTPDPAVTFPRFDYGVALIR